MKVGPMLEPSQSTKMRPESSRYAPELSTASMVIGTGSGRDILRSSLNA